MSRRRRKRSSLRPLLRLLPVIRPYSGRIVLLLLVTVLFSLADAGRAYLGEPLFNKVFLRGGEIRGQIADQRLIDGLSPTEQAAVAAELAQFAPPNPAARTAILRSPDLRGAGAFAAGEDPSPAAELLERSSAILLHVADGMDSDQTEAWTILAEAVQLQRRAQALLPAQERIAAGLSHRARSRALEASFLVVRATLEWIFWIALGLAIALAFLHYAMLVTARTLVARVFVDLQNQTAEHLLRLSLRFFEGERRGDILNRLTSDLALTSSLVTTITDLTMAAIRLSVLVAGALSISAKLSLSLVVLAGLVLYPIRYFGKRIRRGARSRQVAGGDATETLQQMFAGIREVKAFQREEHEEQRFGVRAHEGYDAQVRTIRARTASKATVQFLNDVTIPFLFVGGGWFVVTRQWHLDVGQFGAFLGMVFLMYQPAKILGEGYNSLMDGLPALERVFHLFDLRPEPLEEAGAEPISELGQGIRFEGVGFSYDDETQVLGDITFEAPAGSLTALVGHTGSGKSTLVDLIARFHRPTAGRIFLDERPLERLRLEDTLEMTAVVPQESFLFNDTIRENVRYGRLDATDAEVEDAARQAHIHEEILAFPQGYETPVGERGGRLSGGQVQRLAIARAILRHPKLLILDEATSALDTRTERLVQAALDALTAEATTFVIAHRLSTVQRADRILVLDRGRIVEQGRHEELLAAGGVYAGLVARQLEGEPAPPPDGRDGPQGASEEDG